MTRLALVLMMVLPAAATLRAELLYWMIGDGNEVEFAYASIYGVGEEGNVLLNLYYGGEEGIPYAPAENSSGEIGIGTKTHGAFWAEVPGSDYYARYFVELYNDSDGKVGWSAPVEKSDLMAYFKSAEPPPATGYADWSITSAVPEPTSGMLLLLGVAGLALRRRKAA